MYVLYTNPTSKARIKIYIYICPSSLLKQLGTLFQEHPQLLQVRPARRCSPVKQTQLLSSRGLSNTAAVLKRTFKQNHLAWSAFAAAALKRAFEQIHLAWSVSNRSILHGLSFLPLVGLTTPTSCRKIFETKRTHPFRFLLTWRSRKKLSRHDRILDL